MSSPDTTGGYSQSADTELRYTFIAEQAKEGAWWFVSGPPGLLVTGPSLAAALSAVPQALVDLAMARAIVNIRKDAET